MEQDIIFDETTHTYTRNNDVYISVTTLLKKYGLSPDYGTVSPAVLQKAAGKGTYIHKQLENVIKGQPVQDLNLVQGFIDYVTNRQINLKTASSEELVYNDTYKIAGTIDFQYQDGNDMVIADFKTTSSIHWESVTWQLSIYNYIKCNGDYFAYYLHTPKVFHIKAQTLKSYAIYEVKSLPLIPFEEVEKLLQANLFDAPYVYTPDTSSIIQDTEKQMYTTIYNELEAHKSAIKILESKLKDYDKTILANMQKENQHSISFNGINITVVDQKGRNSLDTKTLALYLSSQGRSIDEFYIQGEAKTYLKVASTFTNTNNSDEGGDD